jgi:hypothetical protein
MWHAAENTKEEALTDELVIDFLTRRMLDDFVPPDDCTMTNLEQILETLNLPFAKQNQNTAADGNCFQRY